MGILREFIYPSFQLASKAFYSLTIFTTGDRNSKKYVLKNISANYGTLHESYLKFKRKKY